MLELKNISKSFRSDFYKEKKYALSDLSFEINKGEVVGFLGANGAGKTTTLKIILGFISRDSGEVVYKEGQKKFFRKLGYLPERPYFYPHLTGREFAHYMASLSDTKKVYARESLTKWSKRLKIEHALDQKLRSYSKGMLQRIGMVCALIHDPDFLIMDEPVSGLDPVGRKEIKDVIEELGNRGKTVFFSSHIVSDIEEVCKKVIVLDKGKLFYNGNIETLVEKSGEKKYRIRVSFGDVKTPYLDFKKIDDNEYQYIVEPQYSQTFIEEVLRNKGEVLSFLPEQKSLEEIIYGGAR